MAIKHRLFKRSHISGVIAFFLLSAQFNLAAPGQNSTPLQSQVVSPQPAQTAPTSINGGVNLNVPGLPPGQATNLVPNQATQAVNVYGNPVTNPGANPPGTMPGNIPGSQPGNPPGGLPAGLPGGLPGGLQGVLPALTPMFRADTPGAIAAPPVSFVDINSGRFGKLEIDLQDGQFLAGAADNLHLIARNMDLNQGELKSLDIEVKGAHLQDFIVDKMTFSTQGALNFDTGLLFNQKMLQFNSPAQAQVTAIISQDSLNKFLKAPTTLERLSTRATKRGGILASLISSAGGFGLTISNAGITLGKANRVNITADGQIGGAQLAVPLSAELESQLFLKDGWVQMGDTKLKTAGQEISPQLSDFLVKKINNLSNLSRRSDDIHFAFTDLKVNPGRGLTVTGTAQINRLRFGRAG